MMAYVKRAHTEM